MMMVNLANQINEMGLELKSTQLESQILTMRSHIIDLAREYQGDSHSLLSLLRSLEFLHRTIREEFFEQSLPNTRHALYDLLKEIEEAGGWPYIERMKLENLMENLAELADGDRPASEPAQSSSEFEHYKE